MNLFTLVTKIAVLVLPFYVFIAVFFTNILHINNAGFFIKEFLIVILFFSLIYEFFKAKKIPKLDLLDFTVIAFIIYGVFITIYNWLWIKSIIHWWRYDFMFLIVILFLKHWKEFLKTSTKELVTLFVYSGAWALLFSILLKFRLKEEFLIEFGYVNYVSNWAYNWWIPIYHWLENSWIRRFQWILDWPNAMWYFLILFSWMFLYLQKKKTEFWVIFVSLFLLWLIILTYSRSALLGIGFSIWILILLNLKSIYHRLKKHIFKIILWIIIFISWFWFFFHDQLENIILRNSSTTGHFDRMSIWIDRFKENIFGQWLAEAGPWYRYIYPDKISKKDEEFFIPESWFIQLLIEWWIIYFWLFIIILSIILKRLYKNSKIIFGIFTSILVMNIFLHIFEATYLSVLLSIFIWLFIAKK